MNQKYTAAEEYSTRTLHLEIEKFQILLTVVDNPDELLDRLLAKGPDHEDVRDQRIPYWAQLWPASIALGRHLIRKNVVAPEESVLEIGCGLGLAGITAGLLGGNVTLSDYLPEALDFARINWDQNLGQPARFLQLDWRNPNPALAANLLLASDIAYENSAFPYLTSSFQSLCQPGGRILAADPCRISAPLFFDQILPDAGFSVQTFSYVEPFNGHNFKINVYEINR
jgi:predicted nicotinamide N-methyase